MRNRNFPWAIIAAAAVAGAGFAGIANYVRHDSTKSNVVGQSDDSLNGTSVGKDALSGGNDGSKNSAATNTDSQGLRSSKIAALTKAIKDKTYDQKGIRVLDVSVDNGNAIVDMNDPVRYNWGSEEEADFINTMKDALAKFDGISTFQIRVDGVILKTLSHFEIDPVKVR